MRVYVTACVSSLICLNCDANTKEPRHNLSDRTNTVSESVRGTTKDFQNKHNWCENSEQAAVPTFVSVCKYVREKLTTSCGTEKQ